MIINSQYLNTISPISTFNVTRVDIDNYISMLNAAVVVVGNLEVYPQPPQGLEGPKVGTQPSI